MTCRVWEAGVLDQSDTRLLHRSASFTLVARFESVLLCGARVPGGLAIGDFYGEPIDAAIDDDEQWCVVVGCGLIAYRLDAPWRPYAYPPVVAGGQWWEYGRGSTPVWLDSVGAVGPAVFAAMGETGTLHVDCVAKSVSDPRIPPGR